METKRSPFFRVPGGLGDQPLKWLATII
jgi:hypothetical protein